MCLNTTYNLVQLQENREREDKNQKKDGKWISAKVEVGY